MTKNNKEKPPIDFKDFDILVCKKIKQDIFELVIKKKKA